MKKSVSLSYLSWKSLKYNKRKNTFVIITISLSVCLLMVIMQYLYSSRQRNIRSCRIRYRCIPCGVYESE